MLGACARAQVDLVVVLREASDGWRARVVERAGVVDGVGDEVDGVWIFNSKATVRERDGAVANEGLEEALVLVVAAGLVEEAEDGRVVAIPLQLSFIRADGDEDVDADVGKRAAVVVVDVGHD